MGGDIQALKELGDPIEGKTPQRTELSGPEQSRLIIQWADRDTSGQSRVEEQSGSGQAQRMLARMMQGSPKGIEQGS